MFLLVTTKNVREKYLKILYSRNDGLYVSLSIVLTIVKITSSMKMIFV